MEQRIKQLIQRMHFLGYCSFTIKNMIKDAVGDDCIENMSITKTLLVIKQLEHYEQLGSSFLLTYSK